MFFVCSSAQRGQLTVRVFIFSMISSVAADMATTPRRATALGCTKDAVRTALPAKEDCKITKEKNEGEEDKWGKELVSFLVRKGEK